MPRWLYATLASSVFGLAAGTQAAEPVAPGPVDADLEWIYSCPSSQGCAFSCPTGAGGALAATGGTMGTTGGGAMAATHVTKIDHPFASYTNRQRTSTSHILRLLNNGSSVG